MAKGDIRKFLAVTVGIVLTVSMFSCSPVRPPLEVLEGGTIQKFTSQQECRDFHLGVRNKLGYPKLARDYYVDHEMGYKINDKDIVINCYRGGMVVYPKGGYMAAINKRNEAMAQERNRAVVRAANTVEKYGY